ncbi:hypothetical protein [Duganella vulcania]|uniref:Uncharacterized protein n=1 Tax=Duganella vulcania TaxID=2692166 RepID=A0A845GGX9_9BURK|nr:hypothetical protein [Duganella vulcania]MYM92526.1 hypothetical protein [Duganella vulcania]
MLTKKPLANYPSIIEVMSLLDCSVIEDVGAGGPGAPSRSLFNLGDPANPAAGQHGLTASPAFHSLAELEQFCSQHMDQFEAVAAELDRNNTYPDAWFWDAPEPA